MRRNLCNILIGSKLLERGITIDNLIFTVFTNVPLNTCTIDTTLQRARWFGYRNNIKEYIKLFTTESIRQNFVNIKRTNYKMWKDLCKCEQEGSDFSSISNIIKTYGDKLIPTGKASLISENSKKKYFNENYTNFSESSETFLKNLFLSLNKSSSSVNINKKSFKEIKFKNLEELFSKFNVDKVLFMELLGINNETYSEIKKLDKEVSVSLMQNDNKSRQRSFKSFVLSQGRSGTDKDGGYMGDDNWLTKNELFENKLVLQLHDITFTENNELTREKAYFLSLLKPYEINEKNYSTNIKKYEN